MKRLVILIFSLNYFLLFGQWQVQNSGTNSNLTSVYFVNENIGFVVGNEGTVLKTINGGDIWEKLYAATNANLKSVFFIDNLSGFIVGDSGVILRTTDGGNNWGMQVSDTADIYNSIYFTTQNIGYIGGYQFPGVAIGKILKTTDGGNTWVESTYPANRISSIHFPSTNIGYTTGNGTSIPFSSNVLKTTNGGEQWSFRAGFESALYSTYFTDDIIGYSVGEEWVNKTTDGGISWESDSLGQVNLFSIHFPSSDIGYTVGTNYENNHAKIYKTKNGGISWEQQLNEITGPLLSVCFINNDTGYAVGYDGTIIMTTNGGTTGIYNYKMNSKLFFTYPNPTQSTITIELPTQPSQNTSLIISNTNGQQLITKPISEPQTEIDISQFPVGIYIVKVWNDRDMMVRKIIKQ